MIAPSHVPKDRGQMSIFILLAFQILFVLFAMLVNIGLIVHDKINLQNSVDLAATYAAQKQAQLLNEMAHINYQIRQDYKLLAWRYHVLGTLGRHTASRPIPSRTNPGGPPLPDEPIEYLQNDVGPAVCVGHSLWQQYQSGGQCHQSYNAEKHQMLSVVPPSQLPILNAFAMAAYQNALIGLQAQQNQCLRAGELSWVTTGYMMMAYKLAISSRKQIFQQLRSNLLSLGEEIRDRNGDLIFTGLEKTLQRNLTEANRLSLERVELLNGLSLEPCSDQNGELAFPEILIAPLLSYVDTWLEGGTCIQRFSDHLHPPERDLSAWDPDQILRLVLSGEPLPTDPFHSSLGFEKNPWCIAYVGVRATTRPRNIFGPFGNSIKLEARSFAQPFGGRIGPWYAKLWPFGNERSTGEPVDPLAATRIVPGEAINYNAASLDRYINFSRFPGDQLGLRSQRTQGAQRHFFSTLTPNLRLDLSWLYQVLRFPETGDPLPWDSNLNDNEPPHPLLAEWRNAEVAGIAPNLFDAMYYSIDPRFHNNFRQNFEENPNRVQLQPIMGQALNFPSDIGSRQNHPQFHRFSVQEQINIANNEGVSAADHPHLYYLIRTWRHLLTGWAPHRLNDFSFPEDRFGQCAREVRADKDEPPIPGHCISGGRVGYSVRLIARDYLFSERWNVGGEGTPPSRILNPPPPNF